MADIIFPGEAPIAQLGVPRLPSNVDISFWKGDAQEYTIVMKDQANVAINLSGVTAQAVIRADFSSTTQYAFVCTIFDSNKVKLYLPSSVSKTIPAGSYVWNFQLTTTATGDVRTYLAGDVTVYAEVDS